jgi:hypothetical protein
MATRKGLTGKSLTVECQSLVDPPDVPLPKPGEIITIEGRSHRVARVEPFYNGCTLTVHKVHLEPGEPK